METIRRFIDIWIPVTSCTLRCDYCYITHNRLFDKQLPIFKYDVQAVREALSVDRLGGVCLLNMCGGGETLLPPEMPAYIKALLEEGHYVMVVTNGTVDRAFNEIVTFPKELLNRLFFKFSYHYLQLKKNKLLDRFFANIHKVSAAGASFTLEATPSDEWIPFINEMKALAIEQVGAPCHVTVARDEHNKKELAILTKLSRPDYIKTWSGFNSPLFSFKESIFGEKRREFCYAGEYTAFLNLGTGVLRQCYASLTEQNIFDDVSKPIHWCAIGKHCMQPHCYNGHAFLTFGAIPNFPAPTYAEVRNRVCENGEEWLKPQIKAIFSQRLYDNNKAYSLIKRAFANARMDIIILSRKVHSFIVRLKK